MVEPLQHASGKIRRRVVDVRRHERSQLCMRVSDDDQAAGLDEGVWGLPPEDGPPAVAQDGQPSPPVAAPG